MNKSSKNEKTVAKFLQSDIPLTSSPFYEIGKICGLTASEIINMAKSFLKDGIMRKFGAVLRHQKAGYKNNSLVVWSVPVEKTEEVGKIFSSFSFISHCYERTPAFKNKYNIFTMIHSQDMPIQSLIKDMESATNIHDCLILNSRKEFKKISPEYF